MNGQNPNLQDIIKNNPGIDRKIVEKYLSAKKKLDKAGWRVETEYALAYPAKQNVKKESFYKIVLDK